MSASEAPKPAHPLLLDNFRQFDRTARLNPNRARKAPKGRPGELDVLRGACSAIAAHPAPLSATRLNRSKTNRKQAPESAGARKRTEWTVYQTVYHGMRYCDQTRANRFFGQRKSPLN